MVTEVASIPVRAGQEEARMCLRDRDRAGLRRAGLPRGQAASLARESLDERPRPAVDDVADQERFIASDVGRQFLSTIGSFPDGAARLEHLDEV